jgi:hypothetical protein
MIPGSPMERLPWRPGLLLAAAYLVLMTACGGGSRTAADLSPLPQPTPDPTLDAVVRSAPRAAPVATVTPDPSRQAARPTPTAVRSR